MEADVLNALKSQSAYFPGGCDRDGRILILTRLPGELHPWTRRYIESTFKYLLTTIGSQENEKNIEFSLIIDTQKCQFRLARSMIRHIETLVADSNVTKTIIIRSDAFWDKQRVENCTKTQKNGEPITIPKSRLFKYFETTELPDELGGTLVYNHDKWLQNRVRIEEFKQRYDKVINNMENLQVVLMDNKSIRANEAEQALKSCAKLNIDVQNTIKSITESGNILVAELTESIGQHIGHCQDLIESRELLKKLLNEIDNKQTMIAIAWNDLEKSIDLVRELAILEDGVTFVTNWILGSAEQMLNAQRKIGCDVQTCEELRNEHESVEMQCWETYGFYAELLHKIEIFPIQSDTFAHKDLMSQKDFMDFVCRSFANRLERRRNLLITSARFYRLVSEYFDKTSNVFESLVMGNKIDDFDLAEMNLQKLKDSQNSLDIIEKELEKEGEKLSDLLSMPFKDAMGRDIGIDYSEDISTIRDILDATIARRNIFIDSVELQKLTLEQVTHIRAYEKDASVAIKWIDDLYTVMIKTHAHVGCNVYEIQMQKEELQTFQETAKATYNYGCQLLDAAYALRVSCKLSLISNREALKHMNSTWKMVQIVSQEQMTRLRVSAVFHRSIEDHCAKLQELKSNVNTAVIMDYSMTGICDGDNDVASRRGLIRKYLICRERLLVEVGRMVRLGRLLKTRLKEPFNLETIMDKQDLMTDTSQSTNLTAASSNNNNNNNMSTISSVPTLNSSSAVVMPLNSNTVLTTPSNIIACDAITSKLTEVSKIAESLDSILKELQDCIDAEEASLVNSTDIKKHGANNDSRGSTDEWNSSYKSSTNTTEDEMFVTASEGTLQSRSSYHTASEGGNSPWWNIEKISIDIDGGSDVDPEAPTMQLLSGVVSSASASFDDSEHSFLSANHSTSSPLLQPPPPPPPRPFKDHIKLKVPNLLNGGQSLRNVSFSSSTSSSSSPINLQSLPPPPLPPHNNQSSPSPINHELLNRNNVAAHIEASKVSYNDDLETANTIDNSLLTTRTSVVANGTDFSSWSTYYNKIIAKQTIKGCF